MIEVETEDGKSVLVPFTRAAVPVIDMEQGRIAVDPPAGILEGSSREED
jgi:16S rRNA processing protein RimM